MIIKSTIKLEFVSTLSGWALKFTVKFKDPDKFFIIKDYRYLSDEKNESWNEFLDRCLKYINKVYAIEVGKSIVIDYFKNKLKNQTQQDKINEIQNQINDLNKNKIEFEVEINQ